MNVEDVAKQIQDALRVEVSTKDAPQLRNGHPVSVDIHAYNSDKGVRDTHYGAGQALGSGPCMTLADWLPYTAVGALFIGIGIIKTILAFQDRAERRRAAAKRRAWAAETSHQQRLKYDADYQHGWNVAENIINEEKNV